MSAPRGASLPSEAQQDDAGCDEDGPGNDTASPGSGFAAGQAALARGGGTSTSGSGSGTAGGSGLQPEDGSQSSDELRLGGVSLGDGCSESSQPLPTLRKDGPVDNVGSAGHPDDCKPCAFYCFSLRGCRSGIECLYCHQFHLSRMRQRCEEWKRSQRSRRKPKRSQEPFLAESLTEAGMPSGTAPATDAPQAPEERAPEPPLWPCRNAAPALRRAAPPEAGMFAVADPAVVPPPRVSIVRRSGGGGVPLSVPTGARLSVPVDLAPAPLRPQRPPLRPEAVAADAGVEVFTYTPSTVVIAVGQNLELWPPVHIIRAGMVFAVSPQLPSGLMLDDRLGLVHGKAQEGNQGMTRYYITACEPGDFRVKIAAVGLKVMETHTPAHKTRSGCELKWGLEVPAQLASVA